MAGPERPKMKREILIDGDVAYVPLTRGYEAVIDATDAYLVAGRNWSAATTPRRKAVYAVRVEVQEDGRSKMLLLHRVISGAADDQHTDHKDGDGLNNRRSNLRTCTQAENNRNMGLRADNTSGFKGVFFNKPTKVWRSEIAVSGRRIYLGQFATAELANAAYQKAAAEFHGDFARST